MNDIISKQHMFDPILIACPSFRPAWNAFLRDWEDDEDMPDDGLPYYIALGDLARHIIDLHFKGDVSAYFDVFEVVERWHTNGDDYVREAATIGFLEGLQNHLLGSRKIDLSDFRDLLGPQSKIWWDKLFLFWDGDYKALRE